MWYRRVIALTLVAVAVTACDDEKAAAPALVAPQPIEGQGVRAYIVREAGATADRAVLTIRVQAKDIGMAAYQGRIEYNPDAIEILDATTPQEDGTRLVNPNAGAGMIKFGGFATEAFSGNTAATLTVRVKTSLDDANFVATLDVAGEATGTAVQANKMMAQRGYYTAVAP
jgi:hypothetical protein